MKEIEEIKSVAINDKEEAFFIWYEKIFPYRDKVNLRMAFDAGWDALEKS